MVGIPVVWALYWMDKTCNVSSIAPDSTSSSAVPITTPLYTGIKCDYWKAWRWSNLNSTQISDSTDQDRYNVVLEADKIDVRIRMEIDLISKTWRDDGKFIIDSIEDYPDHLWCQDMIYLTVKPIGDD